MLRQAIAIEHVKLMRRKLFQVEVGLIAGFFVLFALAASVLSARDAEAAALVRDLLLWPNGLYGGVRVAGSMSAAGILVIVLVAAFAGQEYSWRTLHLLASHGLSRAAFLAAKLTTILTAVAVFIGTALLTGGIVSAVATIVLQGNIDLGQVDIGHALLLAVASGYGLLPYATLALMVAVVTRSAITAVGIGLSFALLIEGVAATIMNTVGGTLRSIPRYFPSDAAQSLVQAVERAGGSQQAAPPELLDPLSAAIVIAVYTVVAAAIATWVLRQQDLTG